MKSEDRPRMSQLAVTRLKSSNRVVLFGEGVRNCVSRFCNRRQPNRLRDRHVAGIHG